MALLDVRGLTVSYGGVRAVDDVDLQVRAGGLVGLIGPNGAGKTSLVDALTGFTPAAGDITFDGRDIGGLRPSKRHRLGLARTFQAGELFDDLSVSENLIAASHPNAVRSMLRDLVRPSASFNEDRVTEALQVVGLQEHGERMPSELSQGQLKLVSLARALVSAPKVLLLDEPAAGLDSDESATLGRRLRGLVDSGLSMLLIDHDMGLVFSVCDWIYVLDFGRLIAQGTPAELRTNDAVIAAYLGSSAREATREIG